MENERIAIACIGIVLAQLLLNSLAQQPTTRKPCLKRTRINWEARAKLLEATNRFHPCYKMSRPSFDALVRLLTPSLQVDEQQSANRTGIDAVSPENKLQMFLRYMSGGSVHDIIAYSGVANTTFYECIHQVRDCLVDHPDLRIVFPEDRASLDRLALGFQRISNGGVMRGCVGALDGWLCQVKVPSRCDVHKVTEYYSGHYRCYGVNVQACCDSHSRFTAVAIVSSGGTGDSVAFGDTGLNTIVQDLPIGRYIVGDNAYANTNKLLTPFTRPSVRGDEYKDSFNFHLSQLRIRIEMAFGLLVRKWRIFRSPLEVDFHNVSRTIMAGCVVHNWCINRRLLEDPNFDVEDDEVLIEAIAEDAREQDDPDVSRYQRLYQRPEAVARQRELVETDKNLLRNAIVAVLRRNTAKRPYRNLVRRARVAAQE